MDLIPFSRLRSRLRASFWFVPALIVLCSVVVAVALVEADSARTWDPASWSPRVFGSGADGSRAMLTAIATSMITVAGVVFSITIVALSLTSTQYSPRVLRNFMRDRPTQVVLGVFVGVFAYCLVVLRTIRGGDEGAFIPSMAVLGGMAYALAGISFLIFFIHHVALSIQASTILARIAVDSADVIDRMFPAGLGSAPAPAEEPPTPETWTPVAARRGGYVLAIDGEGLIELAIELGRVLRLEREVGEFVTEGAPLVAAAGRLPVDDALRDRLLDCVHLGKQRTVEQDAGFGLQQMVDVALRSLSPGINDVTTACMCTDQLSGLLARLARRDIPDPRRMHEGVLRLIVPAPDFGRWLSMALLPIALNAQGQLQVLERLVAAVELLGDAVRESPERRAALRPLVRQLHHEVGAMASGKLARPLQRRLRELQAELAPIRPG